MTIKETPEMTDTDKAREIAEKIITDLTDRKGFDAAFNDCDEDIQEEIIEMITQIIKEGLPT